MILCKEVMTKATKKGRLTSSTLLYDIARIGDLPEPLFEFKASGTNKRPRHYCHVRFRVPEILDANQFVIRGSGKCTNKKNAKSYAAHEVVLQLEESLKLPRNGIPKLLEKLKEQQQHSQDQLEALPIEEAIPNVAWDTFPLDPQFKEDNRQGRLDFHPELIQDEVALETAKALTLRSPDGLPEVVFYHNHTDEGYFQKWANIRCAGVGHQKRKKYKWNMGVNTTPPEELSNSEAMNYALTKIRSAMKGDRKWQDAFSMLEPDTSLGLAKLFVTWPKHHMDELKETLKTVESNTPSLLKGQSLPRRQRNTNKNVSLASPEELEAERTSRLESFRAFQASNPLPIDTIKSEIPFKAPITILKGGTGSGKTTRYPLMLSLLEGGASASGTVPKILVAQPRRLACQTAARHVAAELGTKIGSQDCPIGYFIRFESIPGKGARTIDYCTPGVLLRRATEDQLLKDITHLIIDEVHIRDADTDLLLALAKRAVQIRSGTQSPLKLVLMSATLESAMWESYFLDILPASDIAVVNVPDLRRFPIDIVHLGDKTFPKLRSANPNRSYLGDDESLCLITAELAWRLAQQEQKKKDSGSILCFLPGMEEIRLVHRYLRNMTQERFRVQYLHSSLSSQEQARVFDKGLKIILSTNLAETSLTIPDVKAVIDTGRERQHALLESASQNILTTVVGSQLATVNISRAAAKQRAGRAGRVSAGTCYRLYTQNEFKTVFEAHTTPEMLRMELSQLVLHSLSLYHPSSGHPLQLLQDAPDPPGDMQLEQCLRGLAAQSLIMYNPRKEDKTCLTPLGETVSSFPASPRLGRMIVMGLLLRTIEPAIRIASLLSVPKVFMGISFSEGETHSSDIVRCLEDYLSFGELDDQKQRAHPQGRTFFQVQRVEQQLKRHITGFLAQTTNLRQDGQSKQPYSDDWDKWNVNSDRVGAVASLICCATPHIAHLVWGKNGFATRDICGSARMHLSSTNWDNKRRVHWYLYNELRVTKQPYLHVTTAVSPLEVALFSEASGLGTLPHYSNDDNSECDDDESDDDDFDASDHPFEMPSGDWLFVTDQWLPVDVTVPSQRTPFLKLRKLLMRDLPQQIAQDPVTVLSRLDVARLVLLVLSAIELQRMKK